MPAPRSVHSNRQCGRFLIGQLDDLIVSAERSVRQSAVIFLHVFSRRNCTSSGSGGKSKAYLIDISVKQRVSVRSSGSASTEIKHGNMSQPVPERREKIPGFLHRAVSLLSDSAELSRRQTSQENAVSDNIASLKSSRGRPSVESECAVYKDSF